MRPGKDLEQIGFPGQSDSSLDVESERLLAAVEDYKRNLRSRARAANTAKSYAADWKHFGDWFANMGPRRFPAWFDSGRPADLLTSEPHIEAVMLAYLQDHLWPEDGRRRLKPSTMARRLAGVRASMLDRGLPFPTYSRTDNPLLDAINDPDPELNREARKATAIPERLIAQMANACEEDVRGLRDRAILLVGFCGGLRRSELAALDLRDLKQADEGMVLSVRRSKTDQLGKGRDVYFRFGKHTNTCPVQSTVRWLAVRGDSPGALFTRVRRGGHIDADYPNLTPRTISEIVTARAEAVDPSNHYSGHSLRSGLVTAAKRAGAADWIVMRQTGHRSVESLNGYNQAATGYRDNVMKYLDL